MKNLQMDRPKVKNRTNRPALVLALFVAASAALAAQDASQPGAQNSPYAGVSHPPADDVIVTSSIPAPKPPAGKALNAQPADPPPPQQVYVDPAAAPASSSGNPQGEPRPTSVDPSVNFPPPQATDGTDQGIVVVAPPALVQTANPALSQRGFVADPDGDIVHPRPLRPGELQIGTSIHVRLLDRLSTLETERGDAFRSTVAYDVLQDGQVLIPAGSEIDGRVVSVSSGHTGGYGTMRLEPDSVVLPNGTHFQLRAQVTGTLGSRTHVVGEGTIRPDSRIKRDGIEYGGAVGVGAATGAFVAGPVGALTGGLIGAGAVTVHLMVSHSQATLEQGTMLTFQLTDPLYLAAAPVSGN